MTTPLENIRVLEIGNYIAGPFCATQLGDLGADVIKIESPNGGDVVRSYGTLIDGEGSSFVRMNRNKRSVTIDLKSPDGKALFVELARTADVIVENLRPGAMRRLGLGYEEMSALNPRIVYVSASGWGQDGPMSEMAGLDIMAQARSGLMSITGEPDRPPAKAGVPVCDIVCAIYAALAAVAAIHARETTGRGQHIDVSLFETGVAFALWESGKYFASGEVPTRRGSVHQSAAPYQAVQAADGWFTIGAATPRTWELFTEIIDPALARDERYLTNADRLAHREPLIAQIEEITRTQPIAHWVDRLQAAGVPCSPIQSYDQVFADEVLIERDFFWDAPHPKLGAVRQLGSPMRLSDTPVQRRTAGPLLGADTVDVLTGLGIEEREIRRLIESGVISQHAESASRAA
ncbi:CoA transferase [Leucobacter allii]|uniref:CaiB/BaiF CoA transferase family protein n=1 Tax=Leucobacter allii TaxID=2932247 RepID=UPI001FCFD0C3|nr:CoA transferase [Leucobacter allii]UOR01158.1 CoA transferase [Leucobacter allii]